MRLVCVCIGIKQTSGFSRSLKHGGYENAIMEIATFMPAKEMHENELFYAMSPWSQKEIEIGVVHKGQFILGRVYNIDFTLTGEIE